MINNQVTISEVQADELFGTGWVYTRRYEFLNALVAYFRYGDVSAPSGVAVAEYGPFDGGSHIEIYGAVDPRALRGLRRISFMEEGPRLGWRDSKDDCLYELPSIGYVAHLAAEGYR